MLQGTPPVLYYRISGRSSVEDDLDWDKLVLFNSAPVQDDAALKGHFTPFLLNTALPVCKRKELQILWKPIVEDAAVQFVLKQWL